MTDWLEALIEFFSADGEFRLPDGLNLFAYLTFGATGAIAGMRRGYDIIGVSTLAVITAGGGGLIRDGILISNAPASMLTDGRYLTVALVSVIVVRLFHRLIDRFNRAIVCIDALGLGAYAVLGVQRTMEAELSVPACIMGGMVTAVGGGLLRDILVREEPLLFKPGQFYALVAIAGSGMFVVLLHGRWTSPTVSALLTITAVFAVRMLSIRYNWRTTALIPGPPQAPS